MRHKIAEYISEEQLDKRIRELAAQISEDYAKKRSPVNLYFKGKCILHM